MSIDTLEKRASASNFFISTVLPYPDGDISAADRIQVGGEYSGIAAASVQYPSTTIRERIISAVMTRVATIRTTNGYSTDCGATVVRAQKFIDPDSLPLICVWPGLDTMEKEYRKTICTMIIRIECILEFGSVNPSTKVSKMLSDLIENMLGVDWILPFYLGQSEISVGDTVTGATSGATGYVCGVEITSGTWGGGDAAGNLSIRRKTGDFEAEVIKIGDDAVCTTIWGIYGTSAVENATNNLAEAIECTEAGTKFFPDDYDQSVGAAGIFAIRYSHNIGDPYNNG